MWTVTFPGTLYAEMREALFRSAPLEDGCFLLANHFKAGGMSSLLVTGTIRPDGDSWAYKGRDSLMPLPAFVNRCAVAADASSSSLIFVHTHPGAMHPPSFSRTDIESNAKMLGNLSAILPGRPLGSIVLSRGGACGEVLDGGKTNRVDAIKIVGKTLEWVRNGGSGQGGRPDNASYDRQVRALGQAGHGKIRNMTVAVVGVGGTGSSVAVQLARMGVGKLVLVDKDSIDRTNLPRVYGSSCADVGRPKVDVLCEHIRSFSDSEVEAIHGDVAEGRVKDALLQSDVMFSCTDNLTSRSIANEISGRYYIPLIDVGCRIVVDGNKSIRHAVAKTQVVTPSNPCLWCSGTLDGRLILYESFTGGEKERLAEEGYYHGLGEQPAIISLTTMAAAMAVNKLLALAGMFGPGYGTRTQMEISGAVVVDDSPDPLPGCVCHAERGRPLNGR